MSIQSPANLYTQGFGSRPETVEIPVVAQRDPGANDYQYPIGKRWINDVANNEWSLTSVTTFNGITTAVWTVSASGSLLLSTITTQDATVVVPTNGNINLSGSGSTTTVGSGSTATVELTGLTNHAVLVGAGTTTITKLAVGATGTVLTGTTAADPAFAALGVNSGLTSHGVLVGEGNSAIAATAAGTTGTVLAGSTGADPAFTANPSVTSLTASANVSGASITATGDGGGTASTIQLSNVDSVTISTGVGSVKMSSANSATNTAWIKIYIGASAFWIPAWTTNSP